MAIGGVTDGAVPPAGLIFSLPSCSSRASCIKCCVDTASRALPPTCHVRVLDFSGSPGHITTGEVLPARCFPGSSQSGFSEPGQVTFPCCQNPPVASVSQMIRAKVPAPTCWHRPQGRPPGSPSLPTVLWGCSFGHPSPLLLPAAPPPHPALLVCFPSFGVYHTVAPQRCQVQQPVSLGGKGDFSRGLH